MNGKQRYLMWLFSAAVLVWVVGLSLVLGRDLNWDFLNYHYYGPYLMLGQRLELDYFAASFQSYLNPLAHVPHYLMIRAGWAAPLIAVALAGFHALNLVFVWRIAKQILPPQADASGQLSMLAVVLALLAPLFITTAGSSFADPSTSVLFLAGLWLLLRETLREDCHGRSLFLAGGLLGLASGLKMTNGVLAVAVLLPALAYWAWRRPSHAVRRAVLVLIAFALALVLAHGYWSLQLWKAFGNPVFPLLNQVFQSQDFPLVSYRDTRFLGDGWRGLLSLPFAMMLPVSWLYTENISVDLRFAVLLAVLAGALVASFTWRRRTAMGRVEQLETQTQPKLQLLSVMVLMSYLLWGLSTKIGRYAIPVWLLLGPLTVAWSLVLLRRNDFVMVLGAVLVAAQAYALMIAGNPRWSPTSWDEHWVDVRVPEDLRRSPLTVLTVGKQSYSVIVPFLHQESRVVNLLGQYTQPAGEDMTPRLKRMLAVSADDMRVVFKDKDFVRPYRAGLLDSTREDMNAVLSVYGLRLAEENCEPLLMRAPYLVGSNVVSDIDVDTKDPRVENERLHVCRLIRTTPDQDAKVMRDREAINKVFDAVEAACGLQLNPHNGESLHGRLGWMRVYFNSLHSLVTDGQVVYVRPFSSMVDVDLGRLTDWERTPTPTCPKLPASIQRPE